MDRGKLIHIQFKRLYKYTNLDPSEVTLTKEDVYIFSISKPYTTIEVHGIPVEINMSIIGLSISLYNKLQHP